MQFDGAAGSEEALNARLQAAYGLYYLENRPVLLRALAVPMPDAVDSATAALRWGCNRVLGYSRASVGDATCAGPFAVTLAAARAAAAAGDNTPASLWDLQPSYLDIVSAVARGVRGYSVIARDAPDPELSALHAWLAQNEEELTASVEVRDPLAYVDYAPSRDDATLHGAFGVLATSGYNPTLVDLEAIDDEAIAALPAALFPCGGEMDVEHYGKLVVHTLHGGTLVTYPRPVSAQLGGAPVRTSFLWPHREAQPARARGAEQQLGSTVQVRDGTSTLLSIPFGEPYSSDAYFRLPASQRVAHRRLLLSLFGEVVPRQLVPDDHLEVELAARLSPDGGSLLFIVNRLGAQTGTLRLPFPAAMGLSDPIRAEPAFTARGSRVEALSDGLRLDMAPGDALIVRLGPPA